MKAAAVSGSPRADVPPWWNTVLLVVLTYLQVFGYVQLSKPFCAGKPHTLPESRLSANYPCHGSIVDEVLYLAMRPWEVYTDYLRLHHSDCWVSASAGCMLLRLLLALLAPGSTRHKWVTAAHRLVAPITLLCWVLARRQEPSVLAAWFMRSWPLLDCAYVLVFPTSVHSEAVYGIVSFATSALLCLNIPSQRPLLPYLLTTCAVSSGWGLYALVCIRKETAGEFGVFTAVRGSRRRKRAGGEDSSSGIGVGVRRGAEDGDGGSIGVPERGASENGTGAMALRRRWHWFAGGSGRSNGNAVGVEVVAAAAALAHAAEGKAMRIAAAAAPAAAAAGTAVTGAAVAGAAIGEAPPAVAAAEEDAQAITRGSRAAAAGEGLMAASSVAVLASEAWAGPVHAPGGRTTPASPSSPAAAPPPRATATAVYEAAPQAVSWPLSSRASEHRRYRRPPSNDLVSERDDLDPGHGGDPLHSDSSAAAAAAPWATTSLPPRRAAPPAMLTATVIGSARPLAASPVHAAQPHPSYTPVVRLVRMQFKIRGADPRQVAPGYEERVARVVAAAGYEVDAVYMRRGCIELVVNARLWRRPQSCELALEEEQAATAAAMAARTTSSKAERSQPTASPPAAAPTATSASLEVDVMAGPRAAAAAAGGKAAHGGARSALGGRNMIVVDVRAAAAAAAAADAAASPSWASLCDSPLSADATAVQSRVTMKAGAAPMASSSLAAAAVMAGDEEEDQDIRDGDGGLAPFAGIDIGAIIRALHLDRTASPSPPLSGDDITTETGAHTDSAGRLAPAVASRALGDFNGGGGVEMCGGADRWDHPALLLDPPSPLQSFVPPQPQLSSPGTSLPCSARRAPTAHDPQEPPAAAPSHPLKPVAAAQPWQLLPSGRCGRVTITAAAAAAAAPTLPAGASWWISVYPRVICLGPAAAVGAYGGNAAGAPADTVFGPFRMDMVVLWPPAARSTAAAPYDGGTRSIDAGPAGPAAAESPSMDQVQLLLRSRGLHLPARVLHVSPVPPDTAAAVATAAASALGPVTGTAAPPAPAPHWLSSGGTEGGDSTALQYSLEVLYLPARPGLLLLEVVGVTAVPVVLLRDPEVVEELQAAIDGWYGTSEELDDLLYDISTFAAGVSDVGELAATAAVASGGGVQGQGPSLPLTSRILGLVNLGRHLLGFAVANGWTALAAIISRQLAAATTGVAGGSGTQTAAVEATAMTHGSLQLSQRGRRTSWVTATNPAANVALTPTLPAAPHDGGCSSCCPVPLAACGTATAGTAAASGDNCCGSRGGQKTSSVAAAAAESVDGSGGGGNGDMAVGLPAGSLATAAVVARRLLGQRRRAVGEGLGLSAVARLLRMLWEAPDGLDTAEAAEFRSFRASWRVAQAYVNQWLDVLLVVVVLSRLAGEWRRTGRGHGGDGVGAAAGAGAAAAGFMELETAVFMAVLVFVGTAPGLASAAAWLLLPRPVWSRLAERCVAWRQASNCLVKLLVGASRWRSLPWFHLYEQGLGVWLLEGMVLPGTSLLSPAAALLVAVVRVPLLSASWLALGGGAEETCAAARGRRALLHGCGIAALSVATSLACHWCLCRSFRRLRQRQQRERAQQRCLGCTRVKGECRSGAYCRE